MVRYIVIIPAYNEEGFIGRTIETITQQSLLPQELIIVNDGSTDGTAAIVKQYQTQYPWIRLVTNDKKEPYASGSKVVKAFYLGYHTIQQDYDFLVKFDADLEVPPNYFAKMAEIFEQYPKTGIAGGTIVMEKEGEWVYENFSDIDHVKGAYKSYRKACFEDIGGLKHSIGWDTADELLARFNGWEIKVDINLQVKHHRPLGTETGSLKIRRRIGNGMYRLRYGFWITLISAVKAGYLTKPYGLTGLAVLIGWIQSWLKQEKYIVSKEEGQFIRQFRKQRMKGKLLG
ncbi:MAG: glycosyl transferase family 2 [Saprospiraceae bacterium]|nr:MAG: glycosyl transferase family 2 [Saprospiraceae bacterium]